MRALLVAINRLQELLCSLADADRLATGKSLRIDQFAVGIKPRGILPPAVLRLVNNVSACREFSYLHFQFPFNYLRPAGTVLFRKRIQNDQPVTCNITAQAIRSRFRFGECETVSVRALCAVHLRA